MDSAYYAEYAQAEAGHWWFRARRRILEAVIESSFSFQRQARLLEVGTGTGAMGDFLSGYGWFVGLDLNWLALERSRASLERLVAGRIESLPFASGVFDGVFACDVLEHLEDDRAALEELRRVCRPSGALLITVPAHAFLWSAHDEINHHHRRYSKSRLVQALKESRWAIRRLSYFNALLFAPIAAVRLAANRAQGGARKGPMRSDLSRVLPRPLNALLERVFASERHWLRRHNLPFGVSLLCLATPQ